jgi:hypothetical protein
MSMDHFNDYLEKRLFLVEQEQKAYKKQNRASGAYTSSAVATATTKKKERPLSTSSDAIEKKEKEKPLSPHLEVNRIETHKTTKPTQKSLSPSSSTEKVRSISTSSTGSGKGFNTGQTAPRSQPRINDARANATEILSPQKQQQQQQQQQLLLQQQKEAQLKEKLLLAHQELLSPKESTAEWSDEAEQMTKKIQKTVVFLKSEADKIKSALEGLGTTTTIAEVIAIAKAMKEVLACLDDVKQKYPVPQSPPFEVNPQTDQVTNLKMSTLYAVNEVESLLFNYLKIVSKKIYIPDQYETFFQLFLKLAHLMHEITKKFTSEEQ